MLNSKLNVYSTEWLDVVFANRNQSYGAYELRKNYNSRLIKALLIASTVFIGAVSAPLIYERLKGEDIEPTVKDEVMDDVLYTAREITLPPKKVEPVKPAGGQPEQPKIKTVRFVEPKVVPAENVKVDLPTLQEIQNSTIASVNQDGPATGGNAIATTTEGHGGGNGTAVDGAETGTSEEVVTAGAIEHQPEFPGGFEAFANYLRKNLRYPGSASENGIMGRVYVNFIVERDGTLTDIKVAKGIGFGCDEEAVRVLKKSPKWSAGEQNGRKVRVMFTIPIVFAMGE